MINECKKTELAIRYLIIVDGVEYEVFGKDRQNCYDDGNIIGVFHAKTFEFEIENSVELKEKTFEVYYLVNDLKEKIGTFTTIDITNNDTTKISNVFALDYEINTQVPYVSSLDYGSGNITLFDVWQECCDLANIENGMSSIQNNDFIVESDQFTNTGATIHDVMVEIAKATLDFIVIGSDDKVYLKLKNKTEYIIENYEELENKRDTQKITYLAYGQSNIKGQEGIKYDQSLIELYGTNKLVINDCLFAYTYEKRQYLANNNYDKIKLFGYSSFVAKNSFMPYLKLGDTVKLKNSDGTLIDSIVLRYSKEITYNGVEFSLEAPSITKSTIEYKKPSTLEQQIKNVEIVVDRFEGEIIINAEKTEELKNDFLINKDVVDKQLVDISDTFDGYVPQNEYITYKNEVQQQLTDEFVNFAVKQELTDGSVTKVKTTTVLIDIDGVLVDENDSKTKTLMSTDGIKTIDKTSSVEDILSFFGYDRIKGETVGQVKNMDIFQYLVMMGIGRWEKTTRDDGTPQLSLFLLGGNE